MIESPGFFHGGVGGGIQTTKDKVLHTLKSRKIRSKIAFRCVQCSFRFIWKFTFVIMASKIESKVKLITSAGRSVVSSLAIPVKCMRFKYGRLVLMQRTHSIGHECDACNGKYNSHWQCLAIHMSVDAIEPVPVHRSVVNFQCRDLYFHKKTDHRVSVFRARFGHVSERERQRADCSLWIRYRSLLSNNNKMAKHIGSRYLNKHFVPLCFSDRHAEADERDKRNKN